MTDTNKERADFEAHYFAENGNRLYCESQWRGWKARAAKAPAAPGFQQALDIRTAQGWKLGGDKVPVLYTDSINGQQVCRDDVWLCATAAFAVPPAAEPVAYIIRDPKRPAISVVVKAGEEGRYPHIFTLEPLYTAPPAPTEQWIGVTERLPEWVHRDDTPCHINGKEVPPTLTSKTVLVALDGGGVRTDKLTTIEGKSNGWWHTFGERVIAWQDTPAPPQGAAKGATA